MKSSTRLWNLQKKLATLQSEVDKVQSQIKELEVDPEIIQEQQRKNQTAEQTIDGWPYLVVTDYYRHSLLEKEERLFYKAGFRTFHDVMAWMDNPIDKKVGVGQKRIDNFRHDLRKELREPVQRKYKEELRDGKHPILAGMCLHFEDPAHVSLYHLSTFGKVTTDYPNLPEWIEVREINVNHRTRERTDGKTYCIPKEWIKDVGLYDKLEEIFPLDSFDEHELLKSPRIDY